MRFKVSRVKAFLLNRKSPNLQAIPVDLLALLAVFTMSTMSILNRQGLQTGSPYMAAVIINLTVLMAYAGVCAALGVRWMDLPRTGVLWFLLGGISSPALSMTLYYIALSRLGVGRAAPMGMGSNPLFSVLLGVALLGERPHWTMYIGTVLIVGGIWVIMRPKGQAPLRWRDAILPLGAGFFWGLAGIIRKIGLSMIPLPHVAILISTFSALVVLALTYGIFPKGRRLVRSARAFRFFLLAGISLAVTLFFLFSAISLGQVSRVMAILGATPLLSISMAALFLRDLEKITARTYIGTVSVVAGIALITLIKS